MAKYDYLIAGAGLFGSVFAQQMAEAGKRCLVVERRKFLSGCLHCDVLEGIQVFRYGPHIFHTRDRAVWEYVNRFTRFNSFLYAPVASTREGIFEIPFNMNTYTRLWSDVRTPQEARDKIRGEIAWEDIGEPKNLEERCLKMYGRDLYERLLQQYLEKKFGRSCRDLAPESAALYPPRFTFDNRWFTDPYQGIPVEGYDVMIKRMLAGCDVMLDTDCLSFQRGHPGIADRMIYTGAIDEYFRYKQGTLEYRTVTYENEVRDIVDFQGAAVIQHVDRLVPYTRTIEHKYFMFGRQEKTVITRETPASWNTGMPACYPVNNEKNQRIYNAYRVLAVAQPDVTFCGRLGTFRYYNMDETVRAALDLAAREMR